MLEQVDALQQALSRLQRTAGVQVAFGGMVGERRHIRMSQLRGTRTNALHGIAVTAGAGLGGKVLALARPAAVGDYATATDITHEYDRPVLAESLRSVLAVPVVVDSVVRAVIYGAIREPLAFGDRVLLAAMRVSGELATELAVRDEVSRRLALAERAGATPGRSPGQEDLREANAELRAIAQEVDAPELRERLLTVCARLSGEVRRDPAPPVRLSPRELDVLAWVGLGCGNAEIARRLGLLPETVKSYLRGAMRKLGTHNRHETVVAARRLGLMP
ncbi:LuxR C-terminal-related transcriptional regulator [Nonomuraea sp. NPDC003804]|uniref:helix-turn-helix transcriptional regulator n=1 Tax=Nonomuraea sp. NPDC003804 TaxID=3154547 RepID=UPI00339FE551